MEERQRAATATVVVVVAAAVRCRGPVARDSGRNEVPRMVIGEPSSSNDVVPRSDPLGDACHRGWNTEHALSRERRDHRSRPPITTIEGDSMARSAATEETREIAHTVDSRRARGRQWILKRFRQRVAVARGRCCSTLCGLTFWQTWPRRLCR